MSKEMEINGKKYIEIDVYNELKEQISESGNNMKFIAQGFTDPACVMALGSVELSQGYYKARFSLNYIEKMIRIIKQLGKEEVDICVAPNKPVCFGNFDEKKNTVSGVILAPRYDSE